MKKLIPWLIGILLVLVFGLVVAVFFFMPEKGKKAPEFVKGDKASEWAATTWVLTEVEKKYSFGNNTEANFSQYELMSAELEDTFGDWVKSGVITEYRKGYYSYHLYFEDGLNYVYNAPFSQNEVLGLGTQLDLGESSFYYKADLDAECEHMLIVDNCLNTVGCGEALSEISKALNGHTNAYNTSFYGTDDCNTADRLYELLSTLTKYDLVIWEGRGDFESEGKSSLIYVSTDMSFDEYEKLIKAHPEFDFTSDKAVKGLFVSPVEFDIATGKESELQEELKDSYGRVIKSVSLAINYEFVDAFYPDDENKHATVYLGVNGGAANDSLSKSFESKGAKAVISYTGAVTGEYHDEVVESVFNNLQMTDSETGEYISINTAVTTTGESVPAEKEEVSIPQEACGTVSIDTASEAPIFVTTPATVNKGNNQENLNDTSKSEDLSENENGNVSVALFATDGELWSDQYDLYADEFSALKENKCYLTDEQLKYEFDRVIELEERLNRERSGNIKEAMWGAYQLFNSVALDNTFFAHYNDFKDSGWLASYGGAHMSSVINGYANSGQIGYYNLIYAGDNLSSTMNRMDRFMNNMVKRNQSSKEYTGAELDALELIKVYLTTFVRHCGNIEKVGECRVNYSKAYAPSDWNRQILQDYGPKYETELEDYRQKLKDFEEFFK